MPHNSQYELSLRNTRELWQDFEKQIKTQIRQQSSSRGLELFSYEQSATQRGEEQFPAAVKLQTPTDLLQRKCENRVLEGMEPHQYVSGLVQTQ